jgi:cellulose synthase/poly-beta-1,6-N-acetylglucosamine synthase-like glycosyltransferase
VTEDADLGLRLARFGYRTGTLDSFTHEEANTRLLNWMRQRGRWLKGFLMTWLVHMRAPGRLWAELGPAGFWTAQAVTLGVFASALLHPLCLVGTVMIYLMVPGLPPSAGLALVSLAGLNLFVLVAGYGISLFLAARAMRLRGMQRRWVTLLSMPMYWLMISAAAWYALWQFVTCPHYWNKTEHGLSRVKAPGRN